MSPELVLRCSACGETALADDTFCESCGASLGDRRDADRDHFECASGSIAAVSDRGLVHRRNEDAMYAASDERGAVAVVCDGVSASAAPHIAAQIAADLIGRSLMAALADEAPAADAIAAALEGASAAVGDMQWMPSAGRESPSCTAVAALWDGTTVTIGWAGDSRAYWIGGDGACRLTADHSWAQAAVDAGTMSRAEAESDRRAHAITRWLGADAPGGDPSIVSLRPAASGRLLLCTDGLWNHVPTEEQLAELVAAQPGSPLDLARAMVRTALHRGGHDNVTVAVIDISPAGQAEP